jgi:1-acyl-sn-glycerol-3-phosphate acyltransferase
LSGIKIRQVFRRKKIDEWSLGYWLLQLYSKLAFRIYYRKIQITGKDNIPRNVPVILAPNHQNALMDAMVICNTKFQNIFLARADIFKGKFMMRLLTYFNMIPVYRLRDGIENVKRNDEVFLKTLDVLRNRISPLILFPEGNHGDKRRLRQLVKGLFRIAFMAQEDFGTKSGVKIVPVGIDYGHYQNFRSTLLVNIGKPMEVSEYYNTYSDNPVTGINRIKDAYSEILRNLMIDIKSQEYYDLYMRMRVIANDLFRKETGITGTELKDRFDADKKMIAALDKELVSNPQFMETLEEKVKEYDKGLKKHHLRDWVLSKKPLNFKGAIVRSAAFLVLLPLFIFGYIHNIIPYRFTASRIKNIKDPQFHSSFKFVIGMLVFPMVYILFAIIISLTGLPLIFKILYIILMPVAGLLSFHYYLEFRKFFSRVRFSVLLRKKDAGLLKLIEKRAEILALMSAIAHKHL